MPATAGIAGLHRLSEAPRNLPAGHPSGSVRLGRCPRWPDWCHISRCRRGPAPKWRAS